MSFYQFCGLRNILHLMKNWILNIQHHIPKPPSPQKPNHSKTSLIQNILYMYYARHILHVLKNQQHSLCTTVKSLSCSIDLRLLPYVFWICIIIKFWSTRLCVYLFSKKKNRKRHQVRYRHCFDKNVGMKKIRRMLFALSIVTSSKNHKIRSCIGTYSKCLPESDMVLAGRPITATSHI